MAHARKERKKENNRESSDGIIPAQWDSGQQSVNLEFITDTKTATWVVSRIFEEVDRDIITTQIKATHSPHSVEIDFFIQVVSGVTTGVVLAVMNKLYRDLRKRKRKFRRKPAAGFGDTDF